MIKPIVKWAGGKTKLLPVILPRIPVRVRTYAEPFAGGAAVFFALAAEKAAGARHWDHAILADTNMELVATYRAVRDDVDDVVQGLRHYAGANDKETFLHLRALDPSAMSDAERAVRLIFLLKTCFNGLYRENQSGQFNTPFGDMPNARICDEETLRDASSALQGVEIVCADFAVVLSRLGDGDFAYCDPPYVPASATANFTSYTREEFGPAEQARLAAAFKGLERQGASGLLSNSDSEVTRDLYRSHDLAWTPVAAARSIACTGSRAKAAELLVWTDSSNQPVRAWPAVTETVASPA